jgi:DNA-directed RNA polymerase subunit alpha
MTVRYGKFEMPHTIKVEESSRSGTFSKFIVEPFERGYGHTIGNALRRIMLTSLEAPAIVSIRFNGIPHEYTAVEGIVEDMTKIVLNFKGALFKLLPLEDYPHPHQVRALSKQVEISQEQLEENGGEYRVRLQDLVSDSEFEIVNPRHHLFTITKPFNRRVDIKVGIGRGYIPSERHELERAVDEIVLDSAFSPVRVVNYYVENTRVGQDTDFDRLVLEVTTDGRVSPEEALTFAAQIGIQHFSVFETLQTHAITFEQGETESNKDRDDLVAKLALKISEIELSVRSANCLRNANIETIGELVIMPESKMLNFRNFGKKSLTEIKQKLDEMGLHLGMDLGKYGITQDNIKEVIANYIEEKMGIET